MKHDNIKEKINKIYDYIVEIFNYENNLEKIYNNYEWNETYNAYIIKLKDYEDLKDNIHFDILKKYISDEKKCKEKIKEFLESYKINDTKKIDRINIKTCKELIDLINKRNEYKIINMNIGKLICENKNVNKNFYVYLIDYPDIILYIATNEIITLGCNNNIINKNTYCSFNNYKIINIAKSIIEYNIFENKIKSLEFKDNKEIGYLVDKKWIDEWKKFINYERINFDEKDDEQITKIIKQISIYYENNKKIKNLNEIKLLYFNSINEIKDYIYNNPLIIINSSFFHLISKKELEDKYKILFTYSDGITNIYINNMS